MTKRQEPSPLWYAGPATDDPPIELPAVFRGNQRAVAWFSFGCGAVTLPLALLAGWTALLISVPAFLSAFWHLRRPDYAYLVVEADGLHLIVAGNDSVYIPRQTIDRIERCLNGVRVIASDGSRAKISFLEMRRADVARVVPTLRRMMSNMPRSEWSSTLDSAAGQSGHEIPLEHEE